MPSDLEIRPIRVDEVGDTAEMWQRSQRAAYSWFREDQFHSRSDALRFFADFVCTQCEVFVAFQVSTETVVGVLALEGDFIEHLYVDVDSQGNGVGSALLDHAMALRPTRIALMTLARNERARRFYERRGFVSTKTGTSPPPENEPDVRYEWRPGR